MAKVSGKKENELGDPYGHGVNNGLVMNPPIWAIFGLNPFIFGGCWHFLTLHDHNSTCRFQTTDSAENELTNPIHPFIFNSPCLILTSKSCFPRSAPLVRSSYLNVALETRPEVTAVSTRIRLVSAIPFTEKYPRKRSQTVWGEWDDNVI